MSSLRTPLRDEEFGIDTSETGYNQSTNQSMPFKALPRKFKVLIGVLTTLVLIFIIALAAVSSKRVREIVFGLDPFDPDAPSQSFALHELGADMDASRDMAADPCEDFYQYACGGWVASTDLGTASSITKGFTGAQAVNQRYIKDILEEDWPIVSPFYDACMDIDRINARGVQPIMHLMNMLNPDMTWLNTTHEVFEMWGFLRAQFRTPILFSLGVRANSTNPRQALLSMDAGGLTSNSWRYYAHNRSDLEASVAKMFLLIGDNSTTAARFASLAIGFEAKLVNITDRAAINRTINNTLTESLEAQNLDLPMDLLQVFAPDIPFPVYFQGTGLLHALNRTSTNRTSTPFDVSYRDLDGLVLINQLVSNATVQELVAYSRWRLLEYTSQYLSLNVQQTYGETVGVLLKGATDIVDRSPQCSNMVVNGLSDLFGRYFVERRLPIAARMTAKNMLTWIKQAFEDVLPSVSWMDDPTRAVALEKAKAVAELVGGPMDGNWSDYSQVWLTRETFWENVYTVEAMKIAEDWKKLTAPISRFTFVMNPTLVNAAYSPSANSMNFPAGILNEPFFSFDYPMSVNLGRIGMVEGHELMHGFDNSGRQYDKDGFRRDWWNASIVQAFTQTTQCMIDQYQNVKVQGSTINGKKTLGENIADNSGIKLAYIAFKKYEAELKAAGYSDPVPGPKDTKNPLTSDQLFYWAHAQTWCTKATDRAIANQVLTDVHSPGQARVWVTVTNQPEFAEAFQCKAGSRMNPTNKCIIY